MMKLATIVATFFLAIPASARSTRQQVDTHELAQDQCVSSTIDISGTSATDVVATSVALSSATSIEVYNADATSTINCGFSSSVSVTSSASAYGREILAKVGLLFSINLDKIGLWCKSQNASGTRATVTKCR